MNRKSLISFCNIPGIFDCRVYSPETYAYTIRNKHAEVADVFKLKRTFGYILKIPRGCNNGGDDAVLCRPLAVHGSRLSIQYYTKEEMKITGQIKSVEFE